MFISEKDIKVLIFVTNTAKFVKVKSMDEIDRKIIEILRDDARTPNTSIADEVEISEASVRNRIKELEEKGVIKRFTIEVDPGKLGAESVALVGADVEPDKFLDAANKLAEFEEIKEVSLTTGDHMIMMEIWAGDGEELTEILTERVGKVKGVERICPAIVLEKIKDGF